MRLKARVSNIITRMKWLPHFLKSRSIIPRSLAAGHFLPKVHRDIATSLLNCTSAGQVHLEEPFLAFDKILQVNGMNLSDLAREAFPMFVPRPEKMLFVPPVDDGGFDRR